MKNILHSSLTILMICFISLQMHSQCTPGNEESCPDPEGNGEICPDTLAPIYQGTAYMQEVTMLAPPKIDTLNLSFDLHHITLLSVDGLPGGIDWVTNAENDEFLAGIYYCILFSGTSTDPVGTYPLKIVVDLYALILGEPVNVFTLTDSTSLYMRVLEDASAVFDTPKHNFISSVRPNPFTDYLTIDINEKISGNINIEIYNLTGTRVYNESINSGKITPLKLDLETLPIGLYFLSISNGEVKSTNLISKTQ